MLEQNAPATRTPEELREHRLGLWNGYRSYSYLEAGRDYTDIDLEPVVGRAVQRVWPADVEQRAARILASAPVVSAHDHLSMRPSDPTRFEEYRRQGRESLPYEAMAGAEVDLWFDGGPAAVSMIRSHRPFDWDDAVSDLAMRRADMAHQQLAIPVGSLAEAATVRDNGQVGVVLTLESCSPVGNDLDRLDLLYGLGVRLIGLVYSESNLLGSGLAEHDDAGLTALGRRAVRRLDDLGVIIDVSHTGDRTALDAVRTSGNPVVITHAGSRAVWPSRRMKPDDVIRACAESGGFIGIEAAPHTTESAGDRPHDLDAVMEHVERCLDLVGPDHVAFGPDTNFGDHLAWHRVFAPLFGKDASAPTGLPDRPAIQTVDGCENPGEALGNMVRWLVARGHSDDDIRKIAGGNVLRVARTVWHS